MFLVISWSPVWRRIPLILPLLINFKNVVVSRGLMVVQGGVRQGWDVVWLVEQGGLGQGWAVVWLVGKGVLGKGWRVVGIVVVDWLQGWPQSIPGFDPSLQQGHWGLQLKEMSLVQQGSSREGVWLGFGSM